MDPVVTQHLDEENDHYYATIKRYQHTPRVHGGSRDVTTDFALVRSARNRVNKMLKEKHPTKPFKRP